MTKTKKRIKLKNGTRATAQPRDEVSLTPAPWGSEVDVIEAMKPPKSAKDQ